ncbi:zinc finger protein 345-like [Polypterus senegalus]|uniref:zinc finger protein 345-like n=1 Tax=Polypterus senegalus TaxID=55291 RepID=UPI001966B084|nr:zinc finger protein 345-like [Polypterus senegalus]
MEVNYSLKEHLDKDIELTAKETARTVLRGLAELHSKSEEQKNGDLGGGALDYYKVSLIVEEAVKETAQIFMSDFVDFVLKRFTDFQFKICEHKKEIHSLKQRLELAGDERVAARTRTSRKVQTVARNSARHGDPLNQQHGDRRTGNCEPSYQFAGHRKEPIIYALASSARVRSAAPASFQNLESIEISARRTKRDSRGAPGPSFQIPDGKAHYGLCLLDVEQEAVKEAAGADSVKIEGLAIGQRSDHWGDTQVDLGLSSVYVRDQGFLTNKELTSVKKELSEVDIYSVSQSEMLPEQSVQKNVFILHKVEENHLGVKGSNIFSTQDKLVHDVHVNCETVGKNFIHGKSRENIQQVDGISTHNKSSELLCELHQFQRIYTGDKECHCSGDPKTFGHLADLKQNEKVYSGDKPFPSTKCEKTFPFSVLVNQHERIHVSEEPYRWNEDGECFRQPTHRKQHQRMDTVEKTDKSVECGKRFIQGNNLVCQQRIYQREKPSPCPESKKTFILSENLELHQIIHREENTTGCTECVKSFSDAGGHNQIQSLHGTSRKPAKCKHQPRIQKGEKVNQCMECGRTFTRATSLKCHQILHRGEKPYQCTICWKAFSHGWVLKRHQRIHTGEKPYQCPVCRRAFNLADNLKRHQRIHIGERPYQCSECGKSFTLADHLKRHKNIHMREKRHQKTHKGEQPYQCDECWQRFSLLKSLKCHQTIHMGDKLYLCAQRAPGSHHEVHTEQTPF